MYWWLGCVPCVSFCKTATHGGGGHPLFGLQVVHEGPGPLSRCQYSCRMNLTMESPTAASPGSSSSGRGRAAAEPSAIENTTMASMITAGSTRFLFFSTAMVDDLKIVSLHDWGSLQCARCRIWYAKLWLKEPLYRERTKALSAEVACSLRGTTWRGHLNSNRRVERQVADSGSFTTKCYKSKTANCRCNRL